MSIPEPFAHQRKDTEFCLNNPRVLDLSDPGCGKTRVQIDTFATRRRDGGGCALVICPKSLMRAAWENDFRKFAPDITVSVAPAGKRDAAFERDADVYVINVDAVSWLEKQKPKFFLRFDTLIIDEITAFKHGTSQRSRSLNKIKKHFTYRYGLTGTPNSRSITDVWHPVLIIDDGKRLGTSFYAFRSATCAPEQVGPQPNMVKWVDKPGAEEAVSGLLADITVRNVFEECHDIPANTMNTVPFYMSAKQAKVYQQMEKNTIALVNGNEIISAANAAVVADKLLQIASGAVYGEDGDSFAHIDTDRYELTAELVIERARPSIVFFNWKHQKVGLIKEFQGRGITYTVIDGTTTDTKREENVCLFQNGFYKVLLAHPASAAHGLTLTRATTTIWVSPTYNLEHFLQGNKRIYRAGQTEKTETIVLLADGTIENHVFDVLSAKNAKQTNLLNLLKRL